MLYGHRVQNGSSTRQSSITFVSLYLSWVKILCYWIRLGFSRVLSFLDYIVVPTPVRNCGLLADPIFLTFGGPTEI